MHTSRHLSATCPMCPRSFTVKMVAEAHPTTAQNDDKHCHKGIATMRAILLILLAAAPIYSGPSHALRVDTVAHGVKLSLIVPGSVYPRGVLTRVTVRIQNLSHQRLGILPGFTDRNCAIDNPQVQALTPRGTARYPPAVRTINPGPVPPCVGGAFGLSSYAPLEQGASREGTVPVILGASLLRVTVALAPLGRNDRVTGHPFTVVGRTLQVRLVQAPRARIVPCGASYSCLRVLPPPGAQVSGPLYYAYSARCEDAKGNVAYQQDARLETTGNRIIHFCNSQLREVHLVAGWLNQPVGRLDRVFAPGGGSTERCWSLCTAPQAAHSPVTDRGTRTLLP